MEITIQEGVKPPTFTQEVFRANVEDNPGIGSNILQVQTTDNNPSSTSVFKILSGDPNNTFCIDSSKTLYIQRPLDRDFLASPNFVLSVKMINGYQSALASLIVTFQDENDNAPVFVNGAGPVVKTVLENVGELCILLMSLGCSGYSFHVKFI